MQRTRRTLVWSLVAVLVVALAVTSITAFAKPVLGQHIAGSYRVMMMYQGQEIPHLATFTSDGAVTATFVPLICNPGNSPAARSFTLAHGSWDVVLHRGVPVLAFNLLSDQWEAPVVLNADGSVTSKDAYAGAVQIVGTAALTGLPVKGHASLSFPKGEFQGGCSGTPILVEFSAEPIPALSLPPGKGTDNPDQG